MSKIVLIIGSLCWLFCCGSDDAFGQTIEKELRIDEQFQQGIYLGSYVVFYEDKSRELSFDRIQNDLSESISWQTSASDILDFKFADYPLWLKFKIFNPSSENKPLILEYDYPIDQLFLYQLHEGQVIDQSQHGYRVPDKNHLLFRHPAAKFSLPPGYSEFVIKVEHIGSVRFSLRAWEERAFLDHSNQDMIIVGLILGIAVLTIFYNLFFYLTLRTRTYLYNLFYVAFCLFYISFFTGFSRMLGGTVKDFTAWFWISSMFAMLLPFVLFTGRFLTIKKRSKWLNRVIDCVSVFCVVGLVLGIVDPLSGFLFFQMMFIPIGVFFIGLAAYRAVSGYRPAVFYFCSFTLMNIGSIVEGLVSQGYLSPHYSPWPFLAGYVLQSVFLSLAVGDQFNLRQKKSQNRIENLNTELQHNIENINEIVETKTRDIKSIMHHIKLGIFTIVDGDFKIGDDYSQDLELILEVDPAHTSNALSLLFDRSDLSGDERNKIVAVLSHSIGEPIFSFEVNQHCLPEEIKFVSESDQEKILNIDWNPIMKDDLIVKILVVVRDVTHLHQLQINRHEQDELIQIIYELSSVEADSCNRFLKSCRDHYLECENLFKVMANPDEDSVKIIFINVHTMKGNARAYNFAKLADLLHSFEDYLTVIRQQPKKFQGNVLHKHLSTLHEMIERYVHISKSKLGRDFEHGEDVMVRIDQLEPLIESIKNDWDEADLMKSHVNSLIKYLRSRFYRTTQNVIEESFKDIDRISRDLGKNAPRLQIEVEDLYLDKHAEEMIQNIFVHLIRNAMDHGIEPPEERLAHSKAATGVVEVNLWLEAGEFMIRFSDDGRGLDLGKIRNLATSRGLLSEGDNLTADDIAKVIFYPGFSTASQVSSISGRGVGMDAIRRYVELKRGSVAISLKEPTPYQKENSFQPFEILISIPDRQMVRSAA